MTFADKVAQARIDRENEGSGVPNDILVQIVTQTIMFNDELSTITYFKDITFGVLYEQIQAKQ